jgi:D-glucosaminate-6-phosphate ammonia-lyase
MGTQFFGKLNGMNRRQLLSRAGITAAWASVIHRERAAAAPGALEIGSGIYQSIGVRPLINCRGTFTIITGRRRCRR